MHTIFSKGFLVLLSRYNLADLKSLTSDNKTLKRNLKIILAVFGFLIYANTFGNLYNLDDELVTRNHPVTSKGLSALPEIFVSPYYSDSQGYRYEYRPIVLASFAIEHGLFGEKPSISHFFNVFFYIVLILILFNTMLMAFPKANPLFPFLITLLYASHPVHTEVVASIKNRDEIFSLMGGLLSLYYALKFGKLNKYKFLILSIFFFVFGILGKKSAIPFSFIVPLALILLSKASFRDVMILTTSLSVISAVFSPIHFVYEKVFFAIAIILGVAFVYALKNGLLELKRSLTTNSEKEIPEESEPDKALLPLSTMWQSIIVGICFIAVVVGIFFRVNLLAIFGVIAFLPFAFLMEKKVASWALVLGAVVIAYAGYVFNIHLVASVALAAFGGILLLYRKPSIISAALASLILYGAVCLIKGKFDVSMLFIIPTVFLYSFKKTRKIGWGLFAVAIVSKLVSGLTPIHTFGPFLMLIAVVVVHHFWGTAHKARLVLAATITILTVGSSWLFISSSGQWYGQVNRGVAEVEATEFLPASSGRQLEFVEMPLNNSSPVSERIGTSFYVLGRYLWITVIPVNLSFYYGYKEIPLVDWTNIISIISILIHLALGIYALICIRRQPRLSFAIFVYIACISFFSNLAAPVAGLMADRYLFGASLGFNIAVAILLFKAFKINIESQNLKLSRLPNGFLIVAGIILLGYSARTVARNFDWKDHLTLFSKDINHLEESAQAHNLLGVHLAKKGAAIAVGNPERTLAFSEAIVHFEKAVEIDPNFMNAHFDLGRTSAMIGEYPKAIAAYKRANELDTSFYAPLVEVAMIYDQQNMFERAIPFYKRVIELDSTYLGAYANLSMVYFKQNKFQQAIDVNKQALKAVPNAYEPTVNIGKTFFNMGINDSALFYFEKAYAIEQSEPILLQTINDLKARMPSK